MWVHPMGELSPGPRLIVYEYQKTRHSEYPMEYYKEFEGGSMTNGLEQHHKLGRELPGGDKRELQGPREMALCQIQGCCGGRKITER